MILATAYLHLVDRAYPEQDDLYFGRINHNRYDYIQAPIMRQFYLDLAQPVVINGTLVEDFYWPLFGLSAGQLFPPLDEYDFTPREGLTDREPFGSFNFSWFESGVSYPRGGVLSNHTDQFSWLCLGNRTLSENTHGFFTPEDILVCDAYVQVSVLMQARLLLTVCVAPPAPTLCIQSLSSTWPLWSLWAGCQINPYPLIHSLVRGHPFPHGKLTSMQVALWFRAHL